MKTLCICPVQRSVIQEGEKKVMSDPEPLPHWNDDEPPDLPPPSAPRDPQPPKLLFVLKSPTARHHVHSRSWLQLCCFLWVTLSGKRPSCPNSSPGNVHPFWCPRRQFLNSKVPATQEDSHSLFDSVSGSNLLSLLLALLPWLPDSPSWVYLSARASKLYPSYPSCV